MKSRLSLSLIQMEVTTSIKDNMNHSLDLLKKEIQEHNPDILVLPEMFITSYEEKSILKSALTLDDPFLNEIKQLSENNLIVAGTIPLLDGGMVFNALLVFHHRELLGIYKKKHLFDLDYGDIKFKESSFLTPGDKNLSLNTDFGTISFLICFDLRFPEEFIALKKENPFLILVPGAFNMNTGPKHFHLLGQCRAIDTQCFLGLISPATNKDLPYIPYGHSAIINPEGKILKSLEYQEDILRIEINKNEINKIRTSIPIGNKKITI